MNKFAFFLVLFLLACSEETTFTVSKLKNETNKQVNIIFYQNNNIASEYNVGPNDEIIVSDVNNRGKGVGLTFPNLELSNFDSAIITFDYIKKSIHFSQLHRFDSIRVLYFENNRNIFNEANFTRVVTSQTRHRINNEYTYIFSEQDYLNAK